MIFIILILVIAAIAVNIRIVPEKHQFVLERLGQYLCTWDSGLHVKVPFIDRVVKNLSLKEQVLDFPPQAVITKDNVTMLIDSVVYAKIFDAEKYVYGVENPLSGLQNLAATTLRNIIGDLELDQTLTSRELINGKMQKILDEATDAWGIKVTRVEIKNIKPPKEIEEVMTKQMRAERERRQTVLEAQAHKEAVVARAEGDKQAKVLAAQAESESRITLAKGEAEAIRIKNEADVQAGQNLISSGAAEVVLKLKNIEAMKDVADGQATKIFIPNDLTNGVAEAVMIGAGVKPESNTKPRDEYRADVKDAAVRRKIESDACADNGIQTDSSMSAAYSAFETADTLEN